MPERIHNTEQEEQTLLTSQGSGGPSSTSGELELIRRMVQDISNRYELLSEAGHGSWGIVYRARDRETDEIIALKALRPELSGDSRLVERFKRELRLARRITHKNVCRVYDLHRTSELSFVTMEYVDGENLRRVLEHRGALKLDEGIDVARQVCAALREAHKQGIVHRDLKPENVMVDRGGTVKVMDFGIARSLDTISTATCGILGTPAYMAPEQAEGRPADARTDIYALGLILFEMFTGVVAFTADTPLALVWKQVHETPVHPRQLEPSLPPGLEQLILRCLEKNPDRRYQTADEVDLTLSTLLESKPALRTSSTNKQPSFITADTDELPRVPRVLARTLLLLVQALCLALYLVALAKFDAIRSLLDQHLPLFASVIAETIRITALLGIALRLYFFSGISFDYKWLGDDFQRLRFLLIPLDSLWALSPLLLLHTGKLGSLAFACVIALAFVPFAQRTLVRMLYPLQPR